MVYEVGVHEAPLEVLGKPCFKVLDNAIMYNVSTLAGQWLSFSSVHRHVAKQFPFEVLC